jgi:protein arginine kinase activator
MLCQECRKRPATVHITRIVGGRKAEMDYCEQCAREKGEFEMFTEPQFPIQSFLAGILGQVTQAQSPARTATAPRCGNCGLTYQEFAHAGRFGCSSCYEQLGERLDPVLRRIHGSSQHTGRIPARSSGLIKRRKDLRDLREALVQAVSAEDFERAATLRDEIRRLEKETG